MWGVSCWAFEASDAAFQLRLLLASFMYIDILAGINLIVKNAFFSSSLKCIEKCLMIKEVEKKWQMNTKIKKKIKKLIIKMIIEKKDQYLEIQAKSSRF